MWYIFVSGNKNIKKMLALQTHLTFGGVGIIFLIDISFHWVGGENEEKRGKEKGKRREKGEGGRKKEKREGKKGKREGKKGK